MDNPQTLILDIAEKLTIHTKTTARIIKETLELVEQAKLNNQMMIDLLKDVNND